MGTQIYVKANPVKEIKEWKKIFKHIHFQNGIGHHSNFKLPPPLQSFCVLLFANKLTFNNYAIKRKIHT